MVVRLSKLTRQIMVIYQPLKNGTINFFQCDYQNWNVYLWVYEEYLMLEVIEL